ncbi:EH domain-containing protein 1-like isoform X2 [Gossypium australe]|uniref:EH domain-containing protein 1-like isoform X2 n=1 Tax=Gossypium australe TaxID=47621 RepID=A0A5B6W0L9_9ROSI|nr:EH domain-containing protein 1-like isoform X2 [Gossypium australe]
MEIGAPRIGSCSKEHQKIYKEWFDVADSDNDGRVTGNNTINFLSMSNLSRQELKQVWAIADSKRQGYLGFKEFVIAMKTQEKSLDELIQKKKDPSNSSKPDSNDMNLSL